MTYYFGVYATRIYPLLFVSAFVALVVGIPAAHADTCTNAYTSSGAVPAGYGAAFNPFTQAKELLVSGTNCALSAFTVQAGSGDAGQFVYKQGYRWTGANWQSFTLSGTSSAGSWYKGQASLALNQVAARSGVFVVGYVCQQMNGAWKCGCRDTACATPAWQLQKVTSVASTDSGTSPGGTDSGSFGGNVPAGNWEIVWQDEFNGSSGSPPAAHWQPMKWAGGPGCPGGGGCVNGSWRDATLSPEDAYHDGQGHLVMRTRYEGGKRLTPYYSTAEAGYPESSWKRFGPGDTGTYIEFRANVTQFNAWAAWFAMWLFTPTGSDAYSGDPANGSEIDVMEYVPVDTDYQNTAGYHTYNFFHTANIWSKSARSEPPKSTVYGPGWIDAAKYGVNLKDGQYHTWGIEWYRDRQIYYLDGKKFWENTQGVSTAENHSIRLTIEIHNAYQSQWGNLNIWAMPVGLFENNPSSRLPSYAYVDYVRVYKKK